MHAFLNRRHGADEAAADVVLVMKRF